jgi:cytidyltransferase-like protein
MKHRYGIFIGSFDPVHEAHAAIAPRARQDFGLERIFFSVASDNNPRKKYFYPGNQRAQLLESALLSLQDFVAIDRSQIDGLSDHPLLSIDLLSSQLGRDSELYIIVGQDLYETFSTIYDQWQIKPDRYLKKLHWIVVQRDNKKVLLLPENIIGASQLEVGESLHTSEGGSVHFCDYEVPNCSSSAVKPFLNEIEDVPGCFMCTRQFYREILETPRYYLIFNEMPLVEGHLLIVSKAHVGSIGLISNNALMELYIIKERVAEVLRSLYGSAMFYENGRRTCCIARNEDRHITNHLHLNALPFPGDVTSELRRGRPEQQVHSLFSLRGYKGAYYYVEGNDGRCFFYDMHHRPPEHNTLRKLIAKQIGQPHLAGWDRNTKLFSQTAKGPEVFTRLRKAFRAGCVPSQRSQPADENLRLSKAC